MSMFPPAVVMSAPAWRVVVELSSVTEPSPVASMGPFTSMVPVRVDWRKMNGSLMSMPAASMVMPAVPEERAIVTEVKPSASASRSAWVRSSTVAPESAAPPTCTACAGSSVWSVMVSPLTLFAPPSKSISAASILMKPSTVSPSSKVAAADFVISKVASGTVAPTSSPKLTLPAAPALSASAPSSPDSLFTWPVKTMSAPAPPLVMIGSLPLSVTGPSSVIAPLTLLRSAPPKVMISAMA